ncbi:hypothetical protein DPMN_192531 [Dreissena polymorpha]|uniref:Uncharacterized protein n=1 Tax=Dreissena polymorpha TaxID=45954 RepID=A0A9D3Y7A2_DREPO|nr:hypothetical protein DPMN_192531 [Dreissena polymorpha]
MLGTFALTCSKLKRPIEAKQQYFSLTTSIPIVFPERADSTISSANAMLMASSSAFVTLSLLRLGGGTATKGTGCSTTDSEDDCGTATTGTGCGTSESDDSKG